MNKKADKKDIKMSKTDLMNQGVIFEKSKQPKEVNGDYSNLAKDQKPLNEVERLKLEISHKMESAFHLMVQDVMSGQNTGMKAAIEHILKNRGEEVSESDEQSFEITPEMIEEAQADVADGGFFSVESVTERIMSFAKAISENDPSKATMLRGAFEVGFEEATKKIWGDDLPQISKDTFASVSAAFDEWENEHYAALEEERSLESENESVNPTEIEK